MGKKILNPKTFLVAKKIWVKKNYGPKKMSPKILFVQNKFWCGKKNLVRKKNLGRKQFGVER